MDDLGPDVGASDGLLEGPSGELEGGAVRVFEAALRVAHHEKLGKEVDDRTELALVLPDALLRLASVVNVDTDAHPANDPPVGVADRQATTKVPTVLPVSPAQRRLVVPLDARCEGLPPQVHVSVPVFRVYGLHPTELFALSPREPRVVVPPLVPEDV